MMNSADKQDREGRGEPGQARLEDVFGRLLARVAELSDSDPALRDLLHESAEQLLVWLERPAPAGRAADLDEAERGRPAADETDGRGTDADAAHADAADQAEAVPPVGIDPTAAQPDATGGRVEDKPPKEADDGRTLKERLREVLRRREFEREQLRRDQAAAARQRAAAVADADAPESDNAAETSDVEGRMLVRLAADARLKSEAARWVGERQRRLARGVDFATEIAPGDRDILHKGQSAAVQLWMCRRDAPVPSNPDSWDQLAGNFDALADALWLNAMIVENTRLADAWQQALALLAEAQSALRVAAANIDERKDETQVETFRWLRRTTDQQRIYIPHFMRINDLADPADWGSLRERCSTLDDALQVQMESQRQQSKQWGRLRYHSGRIKSEEPVAVNDDWIKALDAVERLVETGVAPSSVKLRDALLPFVDEIPDEIEMGQNVLAVLREIERYLGSREAEGGREESELPPSEALSEKERKARELLKDQALVLIGGIQRPKHKRKIEQAFGLSELIWLDGGASSYTQFEPSIARLDVAAVVLLIRWSSHGYGEVKSYCDQYEKPLIRVPAGYNPKQLAHQILEQGGFRLRAR